MGKKKIVLDTNILISALGWNGKPREIFNRCIDEDFELLTSQAQITELTKVMNYPRLSFSQEQKERFLTVFHKVATIISTSGKLQLIKDDPDDDRILEIAIEGRADFIISGDPHLLNVEKLDKINIVTASKFLELIKSTRK